MTPSKMLHDQHVKEVQAQIQRYNAARNQCKDCPPLALKYPTKCSFTIRSKIYKNDCRHINCSNFNNIIEIDLNKHIAIVEPRVTMEQLVRTAALHRLAVPVVPEVKSMTVGGAIMGIAGESSSHRWGCFHDQCLAFEILCGTGKLMRVDVVSSPDIFYGLPGSYGSLGMLVSAEIQLIPYEPYVHLRYHSFKRSSDAIDAMRELMHHSSPPDFIEGFVFSKDLIVITTGNRIDAVPENVPKLALNRIYSQWYYQHVYNNVLKSTAHEEVMAYPDYLFRHDQGAFWMGAYLLKLPVLFLSIFQGKLKLLKSSPGGFDEHQIRHYAGVLNPHLFSRTLMYPWMSCQQLSLFLHQIDEWIQERFIIQDFCLSESKAQEFLESAINDPQIFPIWLCPIKGTESPQIFAPHCIHQGQGDTHFIDVGLYGLPSYAASIEHTTRKLEMFANSLEGRKLLYARTHYSENEFWEIYPRTVYEELRRKTSAEGIWHEITSKVLSR